MAVLRCKMCGGDLIINDNMTVAECDSCGTKQTLPKISDDKKLSLYDRANHFRRNNDYDKAIAIFEQMLEEDTTDAEAYWSLVLCTYGIEYVEDPTTRKRVPTVNRAQYTSVFADENYKSALRYADSYQREIYEKEAKAIDEIQKGIVAISQTEEPFDVFICYKESDTNGRRTQDSVLANELYHQLTNEGFKVFFARITLEDKLGSAYEPYIFAALNSAKVMVVLGTKPEYFKAVWVKNEWSRYLALIKSGANKTLIPAYRDMDPYDLPEEFSHLQAQDMSKLGFMPDIVRGIKKITGVISPQAQTVTHKDTATTETLLKRAYMFLEDRDFSNANEYCEKVLDIDPENAKAYVGKLLVEYKLRKEEHLISLKEPIGKNKNFTKAVAFATPEHAERLRNYADIANENYQHEQIVKRQQEVKEQQRIKRERIAQTEARRRAIEAEKAREAEERQRQIEQERKEAERKREQERKENERRLEEERRLRLEIEASARRIRKKNIITYVIQFIICAVVLAVPILCAESVSGGTAIVLGILLFLGPIIAIFGMALVAKIAGQYESETAFIWFPTVITFAIHFLILLNISGAMSSIILSLVNIIGGSYLLVWIRDEWF